MNDVTEDGQPCNPASSTNVAISVLDLSPTFSSNDYSGLVNEDEDIGFVVVQVSIMKISFIFILFLFRVAPFSEITVFKGGPHDKQYAVHVAFKCKGMYN